MAQIHHGTVFATVSIRVQIDIEQVLDIIARHTKTDEFGNVNLHKISAIKELRDAHAIEFGSQRVVLGLKEAKDIVEYADALRNVSCPFDVMR